MIFIIYIMIGLGVVLMTRVEEEKLDVTLGYLVWAGTFWPFILGCCIGHYLANEVS